MRTLVGVAVVGLASFATPSIAAPPSNEALLRMMASCAGRYSATMEHLWIHAPSSADLIRAEREAFLDILEAIMPPDQGRDVLNWRVSAKAAHAALLTRSKRARDAQEAEWAQAQAEELLEQCKGAVLG